MVCLAHRSAAQPPRCVHEDADGAGGGDELNEAHNIVIVGQVGWSGNNPPVWA